MIRSHRFSIFVLLVLVPVGLGAQGTDRSSNAPYPGNDPAADLGPEAEVFLGTLEAIRDYALVARGDSLLWENAIDGLIGQLQDPYATVLSPDEVAAFEEQSTGNYAGIGIAISELNGAVTVTTVFPGTPADRAGLLVGDRIVGVNGEVVTDFDEGWSTDDASNRIRGQAGTMVEVSIERDGIERVITREIQREEVHIPAVRAERLFGDVGYILIDRVTRNSAAEVDSVLTELGEVDGLILDVRQNPGGYLDESLNLADLFLDRGSVLVTTRSRARGTDGVVREESARARMTPRVGDVPIVVLVDRYSASAAEIIAGALQDHDRGLVIGERTFGKGTVQSVIPLPEGRLIRITSGEWYTPQGRSLNRPRDLDGRLLQPDSTAGIEEFRSVGGRVLRGGGGVFPDLDVLSDTLSALEQAFVTATVDSDVPLTTRIQEVALDAVRAVRESGLTDDDLEDVALPAGVLDEFVASLREAGLDEALVREDEIQRYLRWRLEMTFYSRLELEARALEVRSERDAVLSTALRLLSVAESQDDLFARAAQEILERGPIPTTTTQARAPIGTGDAGRLDPN